MALTLLNELDQEGMPPTQPDRENRRNLVRAIL